MQARIQDIEGQHRAHSDGAPAPQPALQSPHTLRGAADSLANVSHVMANVRSRLAMLHAELAGPLRGVSLPADRMCLAHEGSSAASSANGGAPAQIGDRQASVDSHAGGAISPRVPLSRQSTAGRPGPLERVSNGGSAAGGATQQLREEGGAARFRHAAETVKSLNRTSMRFLALRDRPRQQHAQDQNQAHEHGGFP